MPSLRYTDGSPVARECVTCHTTHRDDVACPPVDTWLIAGTPIRPATPVRVTTSETTPLEVLR